MKYKFNSRFAGLVTVLVIILVICIVSLSSASYSHGGKASTKGFNESKTNVKGIRIIRNIVIYKDSNFYSAFPSIVKEKNGTLLLAFRRAANRKLFADGTNSHIDPNSQLMYVESKDNGQTWSNPKLLFAPPYGGSQDPCLFQMKDGTLLCASYLWVYVNPSTIPNIKKPRLIRGDFLFSGGYLLRSDDGGKTWQGPIYPPSTPFEKSHNAFGNIISAYNRGRMCEGNNGTLYWAVSSASTYKPYRKTSVYLLASTNKGDSWKYLSTIATDDSIIFNETSLIETPDGDLVAFLRTNKFGGQACIARSKDGGKTFQRWKPMGFRGYPLTAIKLPDNRVLLVYGYRFKPYGIRARILNPECTNYATAPEIIIRKDGGNGDIGYPWPVVLNNNRVLVVYYFNINNGPRFIAGTLLQIN